MAGGMRLRVDVGSPRNCSVAEISATTGADIEWVARTAGGDTVTEEFALPTSATVDRTDVTEVFQYDTEDVYRFCRDAEQGCACEHVEQFGCPISDIRASAGTLSLSCHAATIEQARTVLETLRENFGGVRLQCLTRSNGVSNHSDPAVVDRGVLTERQRDTLRTAHEMGYFERPREANAESVATALSVAPSTFAEHLARAQSKLLDALLDGND